MAILTYFPKDIGDVVAMQLDAAIAGEQAFRATFDWGGSTGIPCIAGTLREGKELEIGGWAHRKKCKVRVRIEALPQGAEDLPKTNDDVTLYLSEGGDGRKLKILRTENTNDVILEMDLVDTNHD